MPDRGRNGINVLPVSTYQAQITQLNNRMQPTYHMVETTQGVIPYEVTYVEREYTIDD
jgi:hypothetical protein